MADANIDLKDTSSGGSPSVRKAGQSISAANHAILQSNATMITYLTSQGYLQAQLRAMTRNDLIYAAKLKMGLA